ncbi:MAG: hypothetical protein ACO3AV_05060 [Ilumatobacteraceae bacterium]|jgi:hypothetical protein
MSGVVDPGARGVRVVLRVAVAVAFVCAVVGMLGDASFHHAAAGVAIAVIIAAPLVRVLLLAGHWARLGDERYAGAAIVLVAVAGCGALLALL